jgi:hypothetical protein
MSATAQGPQRWISVMEFCVRYGTSRPTACRWIKQGRITAVHIPPGPRGRMYILDPDWLILDRSASNDPIEMLCVLRQCDVARLLGITDRGLRYLETAGKANYQLRGKRKLYPLGEVRRLLAQRQNGREKVTKRERHMALLRWAASILFSPSCAP